MKWEAQAYLDASGQHLVENVRPFLHDAHVDHRGVGALAVLDGVDETVPELFHRAQQVLFDEVYHAVVWGGEKKEAETWKVLSSLST